jgi:hypothetical protein
MYLREEKRTFARIQRWCAGSVLSVLFLLLVGCVDSDSREAAFLGTDLNTLYRAWVRDGRPEPFDTSKYISSNARRYFAYTNLVNLGSNVFHCRFAARSTNFRRQGILAITDEQVLLWLSDDGNIVVSPERNPRFDR